jgi:hypothetical protein
MLSILRAFAWMRWRVFVNSLERTGTRDTVERFSLAIEKIGPIIAFALFFPSALGLAGLAGYAGYDLATSDADSLGFTILTYLLLLASVLCVLGPILLPSAEQTNAVRLLLLPIPRRVLYLAQAAGTISDPWILLVVPVIAALTIGLAAGGALSAALVALAAGLLLIATFAGLSTLAGLVLHLIVRDRRRGELIALAVIVILPLVGLAPGLIDAQQRRSDRRGDPPRSEHAVPEWLRTAATRAYSLTPSALFADASRQAVAQHRGRAVASLLTLMALCGLVHGVGLLASGRLLDSPSSTSRRRGVARRATWNRRLPGLSPGASAVALAQVRLATRTPRGRSILISPVLVFVVFAFVMRRSLDGLEFGFITLHSGLGLATFGASIALMSILPIAMNQFAVDRAGLTLALLAPLRDVELLAGKAVGNALIAAAPAALCAAIALALFPAGDPSLWMSLPLGLTAVYLLVAPAAAALSAVFPRAVDLNSIGRGSNAHGAAGLLGMLAFVVAGAPSVTIVLVATVLGRPILAPVLLVVWCAATFVISRLLFRPVEALFARRRENLAMVV